MKCPECGSDKANIIDSRYVKEENEVRRRYHCAQCRGQFTTYESIKQEGEYATMSELYDFIISSEGEKLLKNMGYIKNKGGKQTEKLSSGGFLEFISSNAGKHFLREKGYINLEFISSNAGKHFLREKGYINLDEINRKFLIKHGIIKEIPFQVSWLKEYHGHFLPKNELGTLVIFLKYMDNWFSDIISIRPNFPDFVLSTKDGDEVTAELEYKSSHFKSHKHNPQKCDYVICWEHNCKLPIPVIELRTKKIIEPVK